MYKFSLMVLHTALLFYIWELQLRNPTRQDSTAVPTWDLNHIPSCLPAESAGDPTRATEYVRRRWGDAFWSSRWWVPVATSTVFLVICQGAWMASKLRAERRTGHQALRASASGPATDETTLHEPLVAPSIA